MPLPFCTLSPSRCHSRSETPGLSAALWIKSKLHSLALEDKVLTLSSQHPVLTSATNFLDCSWLVISPLPDWELLKGSPCTPLASLGVGVGGRHRGKVKQELVVGVGGGECVAWRGRTFLNSDFSPRLLLSLMWNKVGWTELSCTVTQRPQESLQ